MSDTHDELMKLPEHELLPADDHALDELTAQTKSLRREFEPEQQARPKLPKKSYSPTIKGRAFDIMSPADRRSSLRSTLKTAVPGDGPTRPPLITMPASEDQVPEEDSPKGMSQDALSHTERTSDSTLSIGEEFRNDASSPLEPEEKHDDFISTAAQLRPTEEKPDQHANIFDTDNYHVPLPSPPPTSQKQTIILTALLVVLVSVGLLFTYLLLN